MGVGRNDLCPCGSGKKYKKCCMNNKVVSLDGVIDKELNQLQEPLLYFFEKTSHDEAIEIVADSLENSTYSEDEEDRKSTRLNSSHVAISYAVFCLKKKKND